MYHHSKTLFSVLAVIVLAVFFGNSCDARAAEVDCQIVIAPDCRREVKAAAKDMSSMLTEMTGKDYPVVTDEVPLAEREIIVGRNRHLKALDLKINWDKIGSDGYTIRVFLFLSQN